MRKLPSPWLLAVSSIQFALTHKSSCWPLVFHWLPVTAIVVSAQWVMPEWADLVEAHAGTSDSVHIASLGSACLMWYKLWAAALSKTLKPQYSVVAL